MQLIDYSGVAVSSILGTMYGDNAQPMSLGLARHTILNAISTYNVKFRHEYGKIVIACDSRHYWRKDIFPYYKCKRKKSRDDSIVDWDIVLEYVNKVKEELNEWMPWPVLEVYGAEADDIIFTLATAVEEPVLIVSRDHDMKQLQFRDNVHQYNPVDNRMEVCEDPKRFLLEHIMKGDTGDSVPNIWSEENCFALGVRQKPATQKRIDEVIASPDIPKELLARYKMNEKLVAHYSVPEELRTKIIESFQGDINKKRDILKYFMKYRLVSLTESLQDFI